MDIMGSWYNELEYVTNSKKSKVDTMKFRLVFRLRYPYEQIHQFIQTMEVSHKNNEGRRNSIYNPEEKITVKNSNFIDVFNLEKMLAISKDLNVSAPDTESEQQLPINILVIVYYEVVYCFLKLRYNMYPVDFIQLLALKLRVDFGQFKQSKEDYITTNYKAICPLLDENISEESRKNLFDSVIAVYKDLKISGLEAMKRFVHLCAKFENYCQEMFPLKSYERDDEKNTNFYNIPDRCYIALGYNGVGIYNDEFECCKKFSYNDILKWGYSEILFILIIDEPDEDFPIKISFKTRMASNIVYSLNSICNLKRGKMPEENQLQMNRNVTREITKNKFFKRVSKFMIKRFYFE